jgi:hypothetical protein
LAYDLRAVGVDIRDLWRPGSGLTPRYVLMLVGQLPDGSAFAASVRGGARYRQWTLQNHLLAGIFNMTFAANRQRGGKPTKKLPVQPPKERRAPGRVVRIADLPSARRVAG